MFPKGVETASLSSNVKSKVYLRRITGRDCVSYSQGMSRQRVSRADRRRMKFMYLTDSRAR